MAIELSGPLTMDLSPDAMRNQLDILLRVAKFHQFEWLEQTLVELLPDGN